MDTFALADGDFSVEIVSRGAAVNDIRMPDRDGVVGPVLLGYADEAVRLAAQACAGEICGPYANRIGAGGFVIDGVTHNPEPNESDTAVLHGGPNAWNRQNWDLTSENDNMVALHLDWNGALSGWPGQYHADVRYRLDHWSLTHTVRAWADVPVVLNVVSHPYFNLSGTGAPIDDHVLQVWAGHYLPVDGAALPVGGPPRYVGNSPFDFRLPRRIGDALSDPDPQLAARSGIDHAFVLEGRGMKPAARVRHPESGRQLLITTDYPALQVYTGQFLEGGMRPGLALETEEFPDAPRRPDFPPVVIRPGQTYTRTTTWTFSLG